MFDSSRSGISDATGTAGAARPSRSGIANPYSSARALPPLIDASARELGFRNADGLVETHPTVAFAAPRSRARVPPPLGTIHHVTTDVSLFMVVVHPVFRFEPESTPFPSAVERVNPGIKTVGNYANRVTGRLERVWEALGAFVRKHQAAGQDNRRRRRP